jgi:hypothetical protein
MNQASDRADLRVRVNEDLVLDAGWVEETQSPDGEPERHVHAPVKTMFDQVINYLAAIAPLATTRFLGIGEEAVAATAVCLRWGSYLAVLADRDRPVMPRANDVVISRICDDEMARINIEASAALEWWIGLMRHDPDGYRRLARAALAHLPMPQKSVKITRDLPRLFALTNPETAADLVQAQPERADKARPEVMAYPDRVLANALVNFCWRNGPVENIHAGRHPAYPLPRRRIRPSEERILMRTTAGLLAQGILVVSTLMQEESKRTWYERVLPFNLAPWWGVTPHGWSLTEQTRDALLPGHEDGRSSRY